MAYHHSWLFITKTILAEKIVLVLFKALLGNMSIHAFPMGISSEVNVIAQPDFEHPTLAIMSRDFPLSIFRNL